MTSNCGGDECKYRPVYKSVYFAQILQSGQNFEWHRKAAPQRQGRPPPAGGGTHGPHQSQVRYFYFKEIISLLGFGRLTGMVKKLDIFSPNKTTKKTTYSIWDQSTKTTHHTTEKTGKTEIFICLIHYCVSSN